MKDVFLFGSWVNWLIVVPRPFSLLIFMVLRFIKASLELHPSLQMFIHTILAVVSACHQSRSVFAMCLPNLRLKDSLALISACPQS